MKTEHKRSQFTFYASFFDGIDRLPRSRRLEAFYAVALYALDGLEPEGLAPSVDGMFQLARPNIDASRAKAEKMRKAKGEGQNEAAGEGRREETVSRSVGGGVPDAPHASVESAFTGDQEPKDGGRGLPRQCAHWLAMTESEADSAAGMAGSETKKEKKKKNKNKNKSEEERKKETKTETETETETETKTETEPEAEAASPEDRGAPASEELSPGTELPAPAGETALLSLPEREKKENFCGAPLSEASVQGAPLSEASVHGAALSEASVQGAPLPELREPWAEMFRADPILASAWRELLAGDAGVPPLGPAEREKLLSRLRAAPAWERLAILSDRLGSPLSRSWQSVRRASMQG